MSRIGKMPIPIPKDVKVDLKEDLLFVKGPKGELRRSIHPSVILNMENNQILVTVKDETKESKSFHGLFISILSAFIIRPEICF